MFRMFSTVAICLCFAGNVSSGELPSWIDSVIVTPLDDTQRGAITLSGDWLDTCVPDMVSHTVADGVIALVMEHDNAEAVEVAESNGLTVQRSFTRMSWGCKAIDNPEASWASSGAEKG